MPNISNLNTGYVSSAHDDAPNADEYLDEKIDGRSFYIPGITHRAMCLGPSPSLTGSTSPLADLEECKVSSDAGRRTTDGASSRRTRSSSQGNTNRRRHHLTRRTRSNSAQLVYDHSNSSSSTNANTAVPQASQWQFFPKSDSKSVQLQDNSSSRSTASTVCTSSTDTARQVSEWKLLTKSGYDLGCDEDDDTSVLEERTTFDGIEESQEKSQRDGYGSKSPTRRKIPRSVSPPRSNLSNHRRTLPQMPISERQPSTLKSMQLRGGSLFYNGDDELLRDKFPLTLRPRSSNEDDNSFEESPQLFGGYKTSQEQPQQHVYRSQFLLPSKTPRALSPPRSNLSDHRRTLPHMPPAGEGQSSNRSTQLRRSQSFTRRGSSHSPKRSSSSQHAARTTPQVSPLLERQSSSKSLQLPIDLSKTKTSKMRRVSSSDNIAASRCEDHFPRPSTIVARSPLRSNLSGSHHRTRLLLLLERQSSSRSMQPSMLDNSEGSASSAARRTRSSSVGEQRDSASNQQSEDLPRQRTNRINIGSGCPPTTRINASNSPGRRRLLQRYNTRTTPPRQQRPLPPDLRDMHTALDEMAHHQRDLVNDQSRVLLKLRTMDLELDLEELEQRQESRRTSSSSYSRTATRQESPPSRAFYEQFE